VIEVSGRSYPVEIRYRPLIAEDEDTAELSLPEALFEAVRELDRNGNGMRGDTLVFLPGEKHIREASEALARRKLRHPEVLPLFARLSARDQERILRRILAREVFFGVEPDADPCGFTPQRPFRGLRSPSKMRSMGRRCTCRGRCTADSARPESMTKRMPGTVRDVSATLVARTTRRPDATQRSVLVASREPRKQGAEPRCAQYSPCRELRSPRGSCFSPGGTPNVSPRIPLPLPVKLAHGLDNALGQRQLSGVFILCDQGIAKSRPETSTGDFDQRRAAEEVGKLPGSIVAEVTMMRRSGRRGASCLSTPNSRSMLRVRS